MQDWASRVGPKGCEGQQEHRLEGPSKVEG